MELSVRVDGGHLWADDTGGDGPVLVLLHPGWGDSSIWLPVLDRLPSHYRVIRYDIRGFGKSPAPAAPFSQLGDLAVVLDHRRANRVLLVGHSAGGGTAIGLALAGPARVRGLLLLAPGVPDYPWPPDDPYGKQFDKLFAAGDRDAIAALSLRTWAAAGADQAAQAQVRGAADAYFRLGDYERPDPLSTAGSARSGSRPQWSSEIRSTRWWHAAQKTSPPGSPAASRLPRRAPTTCCRCGCRP